VIVHSVTQGSADWLKLRAGIPTASAFDNIVTPTGAKSKSRERYLHALLAERMLGRPLTEHVSEWMARGSTAEAEAVAYYELQVDAATTPVGFITNDAKTIGASPDRLVGDDGLVEIKVPKDHVHVGYLRLKKADKTYFPQLQGQLWITGRKWVDIMSYHPELPTALVRVERDEKFIKTLEEEVTAFSEELEKLAESFAARGWIKKPLFWPEPTDKFEVIDLGDAEPNF